MAHLTHEQKTEIRTQDKIKIKDLHGKVETIQEITSDNIQKRYQAIKEKIVKLTDEKEELLSQPICRAELLALAKEQYQKNRQQFAIDGMLRDHLAGCQSNKVLVFNPMDIRVHSLSDINLWRLFYLVFTEKDIEEAIATLPDIGISAEERAQRIGEIDKQINKLSGQVEKDLEAVKS